MRNFIFLSFLFFFLAACETGVTEEADLYMGVPQSSVAIIEVQNANRFFTEVSESRVYEDLDSLSSFRSIEQQLSSLKNLVGSDTLEHFLKNRNALWCVSLSGASRYNSIFITASNNSFELMALQLLSKKYEHSVRDYSEAKIHSFTSDKNEYLSFSTYKNLLIISDSKTLVEESVRQINGTFNLKNDLNFKKLKETANPKDLANVYLQLSEMPNWLKTLIPNGDANFVSKLGNWAEFDLQLYDRELSLNGITLSPNTDPFLLSTFEGINPQKTSAEKWIPQNTGLWIAYTFQDAEHYHRNYEKYLQQKGSLSKYKQILSSLNIDAQSILLPWVDTEMGLLYTGIASDQLNKVAYFKARSTEMAESELTKISDPNYIEGYRGFIIKKLAPLNLLTRFYGPLFQDFNKPYYFISNDFVWFSESESVIKDFINDLIANKSLGANPSYQNLVSKTTSRSHIKVVASNPAFLELAARQFGRLKKKEIENSKEVLGNFKWALLQFDVKKDATFTNFLLLNEPKIEEEVSRQWSTVMEAPALSEPQFVLNHNNKKYEILIQDRNNTLYLIDRSGKILWNRTMDGPIMGKIKQVDLYKNNKLQFVFNTSSSLFIIDRLGRDIDNFPVKLSSPASAAVGVFNYDRARNYRFVIPVGKKLLNYGKDGKKVRGWNFKTADGIIISQPQLFTAGGKDIISFLSESGTVYLLNRKGENRYDPILDLEDLKPPFYLRLGKDLKTSELISNTIDGEMAVISFKGNVDRVYLDQDYTADEFLYFDEKYIISHQNSLIVKSETLPWKVDLEEDISQKPKAMIFGGNFYAATYSEDAEGIYLFDKKGDLVKGFPVFGQNKFSIGSLKQNGVLNIITSTKDGTVICYEIN